MSEIRKAMAEAAKRMVFTNSFKSHIETELRKMLNDTLVKVKDMPEMMHGMMLMNKSINACKILKNAYLDYKNVYEDTEKETFLLSEEEYKKMIDEITSKILSEFIDLPDNSNFTEDQDLY